MTRQMWPRKWRFSTSRTGWMRPRNRADFDAVVSAMDEGGRAWLKAALRLTDPENLWIGRL